MTSRIALVSALLVLLPVRYAHADVSVPPRLQAELIARIASFDRNFAERAKGNARVLLVEKPDDAGSRRVVNAVSSALGELNQIGGLPRTVEVVQYRGAADLARLAVEKKAAIIYLSTGLESEAGAIARALEGGDVLTIGATGTFADGGANVGFDLVGSRPKIVVNLKTAKAQNVALKAQLLKLARRSGCVTTRAATNAARTLGSNRRTPS
jgi:hypothetical protein